VDTYAPLIAVDALCAEKGALTLKAHDIERAKEKVYAMFAGGRDAQDTNPVWTSDLLFGFENVQLTPERLINWANDVGAPAAIKTGTSRRHTWIYHNGALTYTPGICSFYQRTHKNAAGYAASILKNIEALALDKAKVFEQPRY
jgi:hypothetical protein